MHVLLRGQTMDCRKALGGAILSVCSVVGCEHMPTLSSLTSDKVEIRPASEQVASPLPLKPETLVAKAGYHEQQAAEAKCPPALREQFWAEAHKSYQRALAIDAKHVPAYLGEARLYEKTGDVRRAGEYYQQALKLAPRNASVNFEIGMFLARQKDWNGAVERMAKTAELEPGSRQYHKMLGLCLARAGRFDESLACLKKEMNDAHAHCTLARMLYQMKQDELARDHIRLALQIDPKLASAQKLQAELDGTAPTTSTVQEQAGSVTE